MNIISSSLCSHITLSMYLLAEVKHTTDLAAVEVRKGFSHVHQHNMEAGGNENSLIKDWPVQ